MIPEQAEMLRFVSVPHHEQLQCRGAATQPVPNQPRTRNETTASHTARGPRISQALTEM